LAAEIENLYSISEYLANHPEFIMTIIVSTPKLAGTVENGTFDNQSSMEEFKKTVDNRAVRIAELIRTFFPSINRRQIITKTVTGKKIIILGYLTSYVLFEYYIILFFKHLDKSASKIYYMEC
jgi:hypothetical protein